MHALSKKLSHLLAYALALIILAGTWSASAEMTVPAGLSSDEFSQQASVLLREAAGQQAQGLALVLFSDTGILTSQGFGLADPAGQNPVLPDQTGFEYGSVSKVLVWLSLMQLAEAGKLSLTDDISHHLPEGFYQALHLNWPVTLLDLMNHQAGFEEYPLDMIVPENAQAQPLPEALLLTKPRQRFKPGTVSAYSNFGCALAGFVVEYVSGQPFERYIEEHFFKPLGMASCGMNQDQAHGGMAQGSALDEAGHFMPVAPSRVSLSPAGGVRGTAEDLAKLGMALLSRDARLLSKSSSYDLLFSDSFAPFPGADGIAHGFFTMNAQHAKGYQHPGNTNGFTAQITLVPECRIGYVLLTNTAYTNPLSSALNHLLMGPPAQLQVPSTEKPPSQSGWYLSPRNAFSLPFYSLLSYANTYHLKVEGDKAILTSALLRLGGFFGQDDMRLEAERKNGSFYQVTNRPEMVESLYLKTQEGRVRTVWADGSALVSLDQTPRASFPFVLGTALMMLLLMTGFILSFLFQAAVRLLRRVRGRERRRMAPFLISASGAVISLIYFAGLSFVASHESPGRQALDAWTAALLAASVAAWVLIVYYVIRSRKSPWDRRTARSLIRRGCALMLLMALMVYWGQYHFV
jgi:CubicO group peptidase (beta-lactamase class C family)